MAQIQYTRLSFFPCSFAHSCGLNPYRKRKKNDHISAAFSANNITSIDRSTTSTYNSTYRSHSLLGVADELVIQRPRTSVGECHNLLHVQLSALHEDTLRKKEHMVMLHLMGGKKKKSGTPLAMIGTLPLKSTRGMARTLPSGLQLRREKNEPAPTAERLPSLITASFSQSDVRHTITTLSSPCPVFVRCSQTRTKTTIQSDKRKAMLTIPSMRTCEARYLPIGSNATPFTRPE